MDSIITAAVTEICSRNKNGLVLKELWARLEPKITTSGLNLCPGVKTSIWNALLNIPNLQFTSKKSTFSPQDSAIKSVEDSEKLGLKIVAGESLRDCFLGIYDTTSGDSGISPPQRAVLERLGGCRTNGITQKQLTDESGMKANNIFYVLRNLEVRGLIVRQSTIVRTKENVHELETTSIVNTNLIHLHRYAKPLSSQQRLEITKSDTLETLGDTTMMKDDVLLKDYVPAMKAICDKLEEADGKVLVVSDIKQDLGYRDRQGHRAWRHICKRLKDAHLVEEFQAKVNKKVVSCLRLLKHIGLASDDFDTDQSVKCGKRGQMMNQYLELPIEHQIYDLVDSKGPKGLTVTEVFKHLGLNNKRNYSRLLGMCSRFGMHLEAESHNRSKQYRIWTSGNFTDNSANVLPGKSGDMLSMRSVNDIGEREDQTIHLLESPASKDEFRSSEEKRGLELSYISPGDGASCQLLICGSNPHGLGCDATDGSEEHDLVNMVTESISVPSETPTTTPSNQLKRQSYPRHPCLSLATESSQREKMILKRLQDEKFVLTVELYKWLESLEKEKHTTMAKKTLTRTLSKLQQEGQCRCIHVSVPLVTNCGRSRTTEVVLHKSLQSSLPPELLGQIHERLRFFEMQSRGQGITRVKNDTKVPVLSNIDRTLKHGGSDSQAVKAEAMRANGYVPAKMVRAKLLHNFLWGYLRNSPDWDDAQYSRRPGYDLNNPHSSCKLFTLIRAIKAMPLELFLQVVGSTEKFEDLVENCKRGLSLVDLPPQEYTSLMDKQATQRLSSIVHSLCRLKLIRLVTDGHLEDSERYPLAILTYGMELKPYIEEPLSRVSLSFGVSSPDLRPRIRHDFVLSNREAVDIYWKNLEYCYATADPKAAVHAFPGSAVQEVFLYRSWTSVRVMTADQRAELLKRIVRDDLDKKISFADSVKIARELNLTLEQVLRVSNDKRQARLNRFQNYSNANKNSQPRRRKLISASQKRKKSLKAEPSKRLRSEERSLCMTDLEDDDIPFQACDEGLQARTAEDSGPDEEQEEDEENYDFISRCALSRLKPSRRPKFSWTETSEKQLVIQYVRHRAALGARFHRTDWVSLPDLPALPDACRRRMQLLNHNPTVRSAVLRLCNLLGERYTRHLAKTQQKQLLSRDISRQIILESSSAVPINKTFSHIAGRILESDLKEHQWDDFEDPNIKVALNEVLRCKQVAKVEVSRRSGPAPQKEWSDKYMAAQACDSQEETESTTLMATGEEAQGHDGSRQRRARCHRLPGKFLKLLNEGISVSRRAFESLAVSSAVELLKLVFLSTSSAPEVPSLLAETLRRYSEHDLFAAFNYLREKKFMVGGNGSQPFVLSQQFLHSVSSSPFPINTGKRAAKFVSWLREREQELMEGTIDLNEELQCGEIFHLLALVSSGELVITPSLPDEGIGEADESRNVKRKDHNDEVCSINNVKKLKSLVADDGEVVSRRAKGFPGIKVSVNRITISKAHAVDLIPNAVDLIPNGSALGSSCMVAADDRISSLDLETTSSLSPSKNFGRTLPLEMNANGSPWEAMSRYGDKLLSNFSDKELLSPLYPELFKTAYSMIYKAGDQGLSLEQISQVLALQGEKLVELVVDVLHVFGVAVKVNAYIGARIVDASFHSKYFLTTVEGRYQDLRPAPHVGIPRSDRNCFTLPEEYHTSAETSMRLDDVHKVTLLNLPEAVPQLSNQVEISSEGVRHREFVQVEGTVAEGFRESKTAECMTSVVSHSFRPILPWINGDGTKNPIVYKGLVRRVLGIVMQNPGILEADITYRMDVLNPQSCRELLELMILDNQLIPRKMHQTICSRPPTILGFLGHSGFSKSVSEYREHFFANPMSTSLL